MEDQTQFIALQENESSSDDPDPSEQYLNCDSKSLFYSKDNLENFLDFQKKSSLESIQPSEKTLAFMKKHFPGISVSDWNSWEWQLSNSIKTLSDLERILELSESEKEALSLYRECLPLRITPYYMSLIDPKDPLQGIRKSVVPVMDEHKKSRGEAEDPLGEDHDSPVNGLVHRYPDRVLFLATNFCSTYCRYCTRSRMVGDKSHSSRQQWEKAFEYIEHHKEIRDVLISGGDPLTMPDESIDYLLSRLRKIPHVEFIRIGTKVPAVLPQRVTHKLTQILKRYHPLWISIHFTHADEMTPETRKACERLADAGIPLGSQTVLLKGINDNVDSMKGLFHALLRSRVKPYYLYQCDPILGSSHFRTRVEKGLEIIQGLRGWTSGYAVPHYVIDAPDGGGKIPLLPEYYQGRENGNVVLKNYEGKLFSYPDFLEE